MHALLRLAVTRLKCHSVNSPSFAHSVCSQAPLLGAHRVQIPAESTTCIIRD